MGIEKVTFSRRGGNFDNLLFEKRLFKAYPLNTIVPDGLNIDFDVKRSLCIEFIVYCT